MAHDLDLTQGSVRKQLIRYALPLVTTSVMQGLYSIIDIIIAGQFVGKEAVSAINNSSQIMGLLTQIAIGFTLGGNILIGQYFGSKDEKGRKQATGTLFLLSMVLGAVISVWLYFSSESLLTLLGAPSLKDAVIYLKICSAGYVFILGYNGLSAILRGVGNSKVPLRCITVATVLNIILDLFFVLVLHKGVEGMALATVAAQIISYIMALLYLIKAKDYFGFHLTNLRIRADQCKKICQLGVPCMLQWTIASLSWLVVTYFINQYGVDVSAGNGISIKIKDFCQLFISAMSSGASTMIAQTLGAQMYDRAKEVMYEAMKITVGLALIIIVIVELAAPLITSVFTSDVSVADAAVLNLRIEIIGQTFYASFLIYHSLMTGAGHTWIVMGSSFVNCILFRVVLVIILNQYFGIMGVYLGCMIAPSSSIPIGWIYTKSNIWRRKIV